MEFITVAATKLRTSGHSKIALASEENLELKYANLAALYWRLEALPWP